MSNQHSDPVAVARQETPGDRVVAAADAATERLCLQIDRATSRMVWGSAMIATLGLAVFFAAALG